MKTYTKALRDFASDEEILECLILFEDRKMDAAKLLSAYMSPKWRVNTIEAFEILLRVSVEMSKKAIK